MSGFDTTYTGPAAALREDRAFQLARARADLEFALCCARDTDDRIALPTERDISPSRWPAYARVLGVAA